MYIIPFYKEELFFVLYEGKLTWWKTTASEKERQHICGKLFLRISLIKLSKVLGIRCCTPRCPLNR